MIASCNTLSNLRCLEVSDNKIKDEGVKALTQGKYSQLEDIALNDNKLTVNGIYTLKNLGGISYLAISGNELTDDDIPKILQINPNRFVFLGLSRNQLTDTCLAELMNISGLEVLLVDRNKITTDRSQLKIRENQFVFY